MVTFYEDDMLLLFFSHEPNRLQDVDLFRREHDILATVKHENIGKQLIPHISRRQILENTKSVHWCEDEGRGKYLIWFGSVFDMIVQGLTSAALSISHLTHIETIGIVFIWKKIVW